MKKVVFSIYEPAIKMIFVCLMHNVKLVVLTFFLFFVFVCLTLI